MSVKFMKIFKKELEKNPDLKTKQTKEEIGKPLFQAPVYPRSMVSKDAAVNQAAKPKTDIRYIWNKFVIESGGVNEAVNRCYTDLKKANEQGKFCDVSNIDFTNPSQAISQVVTNIEERQKELKEQQEREQQEAKPAPTATSESKTE